MDDKEVKTEEVSIKDAQTANDNTTTDTADVANEMAERFADLNDKYLRLAAELENTRRRASVDAENAARNRAMNISGKFLPVMDAVDAALKHNPDDEGIKSMARALESVFAEIGIKRINSLGEALNPQYHNAIQVMSIADATPNTVVEELQPGYLFGDNVLRTAMVIVAK